MGERALWVARVHGDGGRFERAELSVEEGSGRFVLRTWNAGEESADRAVIERDDVVRLAEVLEDVLHEPGAS